MSKSKKAKLDFNPIAVIKTVSLFKKLVNIMKGRYGYILDGKFLKNVNFRSQINGKMILPLKQMLREEIEPVKDYLKEYMKILKSIKDLDAREAKEGFSISIKGAGTKQKVIKSLKDILYQIENYPIDELQNGFTNSEDKTLVFDSASFEAYAGYSIADEENQK